MTYIGKTEVKEGTAIKTSVTNNGTTASYSFGYESFKSITGSFVLQGGSAPADTYSDSEEQKAGEMKSDVN